MIGEPTTSNRPRTAATRPSAGCPATGLCPASRDGARYALDHPRTVTGFPAPTPVWTRASRIPPLFALSTARLLTSAARSQGRGVTRSPGHRVNTAFVWEGRIGTDTGQARIRFRSARTRQATVPRPDASGELASVHGTALVGPRTPSLDRTRAGSRPMFLARIRAHWSFGRGRTQGEPASGNSVRLRVPHR